MEFSRRKRQEFTHPPSRPLHPQDPFHPAMEHDAHTLAGQSHTRRWVG